MSVDGYVRIFFYDGRATQWRPEYQETPSYTILLMETGSELPIHGTRNKVFLEDP